MAAQSLPKRAAWEDRFREPGIDELLKAIQPGTGAEATQTIRERLLASEGVTESVEWQGVPWRWSLVYSCPMDPTRAFAYIIPDPAKAQLAVPLTVAMVQSLPLKRMKKAVRDGILFSRFVAGVYWPCWQLDLVPQPSDLSEIIQRKYRSISGEWGGTSAPGSGGPGSAAPAVKPPARRPDNAR